MTGVQEEHMTPESLLQYLMAGVFVMLAAGAGAQAQDGKVSGWLEVKGQKTALTHVFAMAEVDRLEPGDKEIIAVLLSTKPVPEELRKAGSDWLMWAGDEAQAGRMEGIVLMIDPQTGVWGRGQRLSKAHGLTFYSHTSSSAEGRMLRFDKSAAGGKELAGKVSMRETMKGVEESEGPWQVQAEFSVPVVQMEAVTAKISGKEALNSPQYKAIMAFLQACKNKDVEAIKKSMDGPSQAQFAKMIEQMGRADALEMLKAMAEDSLSPRIAEVVVRGSKAEVKLMKAGNERDEMTLSVAMENGVWKMAR